jgi:hypothetical protein
MGDGVRNMGDGVRMMRALSFILLLFLKKIKTSEKDQNNTEKWTNLVPP